MKTIYGTTDIEIDGVQQISAGGTGRTTSTAALTALGAASSDNPFLNGLVTITGNLSTTGNVTIAGTLSSKGTIFSDSHVFIDKLPSTSDLNTVNTPYIWFSNGGDSASSITCNEAIVFLSPIWVSTDCVIVSGGTIAGTNAGAIDIDIGLYGCNKNGLPDDRFAYANISLASTVAGTVIVGNTNSVSVKRGMYWGALMVYGTGTSAAIYQSIPSSLSITGGTNLRAFHANLDRILQRYSGINNKVALNTSLPTNTRLLTNFFNSGRVLDYSASGSTQSSYRTRVDCPFVFFVPRM